MAAGRARRGHGGEQRQLVASPARGAGPRAESAARPSRHRERRLALDREPAANRHLRRRSAGERLHGRPRALRGRRVGGPCVGNQPREILARRRAILLRACAARRRRHVARSVSRT
ncbi:MAG: hypothetical protein MZV70_19715 [Desulfobacterales bacterium]|nr:hypothetical protein [Desulfobacterales bacterium]